MCPKTERWRKVPRLISQRNGVSHPVRNPLLWRGKPAAASTKTHQQLGGFSPNVGAVHIHLQRSNWTEHVKLLILTRSKGRRMERVKCDHLRAKRCGQDLGNVTRPRPQGQDQMTRPDPGRKSIHISLTERACKSPTLFNDVSANKRVTLRVSIRSGADSRGSKGAATRPSRTTDRSQEGSAVGRVGLSRLTPRINAETIRCLPRGTSSSSLRAAMAVT